MIAQQRIRRRRTIREKVIIDGRGGGRQVAIFPNALHGGAVESGGKALGQIPVVNIFEPVPQADREPGTTGEERDKRLCRSVAKGTEARCEKPG